MSGVVPQNILGRFVDLKEELKTCTNQFRSVNKLEWLAEIDPASENLSFKLKMDEVHSQLYFP